MFDRIFTEISPHHVTRHSLMRDKGMCLSTLIPRATLPVCSQKMVNGSIPSEFRNRRLQAVTVLRCRTGRLTSTTANRQKSHTFYFVVCVVLYPDTSGRMLTYTVVAGAWWRRPTGCLNQESSRVATCCSLSNAANSQNPCPTAELN